MRESIEQAIAMNGAAVALNTAAFALGRRAGHDPAAVAAMLAPAVPALGHRRLSESLDELIDRRAAFLEAYQDADYAARFRRRVLAIRTAEARVAGAAATALTRAAARGLFKLMAVKDEYEVARLYTDGTFEKQLAESFESWDRLDLHLAPPGIARRDTATGHLTKRSFGPWMLGAFRVLARLRRLRGTALDPFGYSAERRTERRLIADYEGLLDEVVRDLGPGNHAAAIALVDHVQAIRGYGHVKERSIAAAATAGASLHAAFRAAKTAAPAVADAAE
jgi:indolepyruvate ferredoxin oxidoreductase